MDFFPIFMDIRGKNCLVVGGGEVAVRKASMLMQSGAWVTVVAPEICAAFDDLIAQDRLIHRQGFFSPEFLDNAELVIAATNDRAVNQQVSELAKQRRIPVNVVDDPEYALLLCRQLLTARRCWLRSRPVAQRQYWRGFCEHAWKP